MQLYAIFNHTSRTVLLNIKLMRLMVPKQIFESIKDVEDDFLSIVC